MQTLGKYRTAANVAINWTQRLQNHEGCLFQEGDDNTEDAYRNTQIYSSINSLQGNINWIIWGENFSEKEKEYMPQIWE